MAALRATSHEVTLAIDRASCRQRYVGIESAKFRLAPREFEGVAQLNGKSGEAKPSVEVQVPFWLCGWFSSSRAAVCGGVSSGKDIVTSDERRKAVFLNEVQLGSRVARVEEKGCSE